MNTAIGAEFRGVEGAGATEMGEQAGKARGCGCDCHKPAEVAEVTVTDPAALKDLLAYLAADKNEQEDKR